MRYVEPKDIMEVVLAADKTAWSPIIVGDKVVITTKDGKTGEAVNCKTTGVWGATSSAAIAQGENVKFDSATGLWATAGSSDPIHGYAHKGVGAAGEFQVAIG